MSYSIATVFDADGTASGGTIGATGTLTVGGRAPILIVGAGFSDLVSGVSDGTSNSYSHVTGGSLANPGSSGLFYSLWECKNIVTGGSQTVTATYSSAVTQRAIAVVVATGLDTSAAAAINTTANITPGNGTDIITSGTATPGAQPAMVLGFAQDVTADFSSLTAGTGFTSHSLPNFSLINSGCIAICEDKRVTSTSAVAATFSTAAGGGDDYAALVYIVPETSTGNTGITPGAGSATCTGNTAIVTPRLNTVITPVRAQYERDTSSGLLVPSRKIFLPPMKIAA
jgi:hypothetical protein